MRRPHSPKGIKTPTKQIKILKGIKTSTKQIKNLKGIKTPTKKKKFFFIKP
jgi:hypothetical protein